MFNPEQKCKTCIIRGADAPKISCPLTASPTPPCGWRREEAERRKTVKLAYDERTGKRRKFIFRGYPE